MNRNYVKNLPGEIWKVIEDYPFYSISNMGRVKKNECERFVILGGFAAGKGTIIYYPERLLTANKGSNGYMKVTLQKDRKTRTETVHRLVAKAFIPNPCNYPEVNHKDENKDNNCAYNLEWVTGKTNCNYGTRTQRMKNAVTGRKKPPLSSAHKKKLSESLKGVNGKQVYCDGQLFRSAREAAEKYNVVPATMRNWLNGYNPMPQKFKDMGLKYDN